jgi:hypothetical protein
MATRIGNGLDLLLQRIVNLGDPSGPTDAVTKQYVDNLIRGLDWKQSVKAASTGNVTLTGAQTIDGVSLVAGDRVLLKNQTDGTQNGIWVVAAGAWSRPTDFNDSTAVTSAAATSVELGTSNKDTVYVLTTDGTITIGTTAQTWSQLGGGITYTAGNGIIITGSSIAAQAGTGGGLLVDATGIRRDPSVVPAKFAANVPTGTSCAVSHGLGSTDVIVALYDISGAKPVAIITDATITDANTVTLTFATAATSGQYRCVVMG